jgi:hypothetical protein
MSRYTPFVLPLALLLAMTARADDPAVSIGEARTDADGIRVHSVRSPYQAGSTSIRVLLPGRLDPTAAYAVVYVLPVEKRDEARYGDGLLEAKRAGLHDRHRSVFVAPTFSHLPWYADHPADPLVRQEGYLLRVVVPFVERAYPVRSDPGGRLLLGFSKSGWGAFALLLRHPGVFGRAAAWDAPLMMDAPGKYGSGDIFATRENFEHYRVDKLLERRAADLKTGKRIVLAGHANFAEHHRQAAALMERLGIGHAAVADEPGRKHEWGSGWLPGAVVALSPPEPRRRE